MIPDESTKLQLERGTVDGTALEAVVNKLCAKLWNQIQKPDRHSAGDLVPQCWALGLTPLVGTETGLAVALLI